MRTWTSPRAHKRVAVAPVALTERPTTFARYRYMLYYVKKNLDYAPL